MQLHPPNLTNHTFITPYIDLSYLHIFTFRFIYDLDKCMILGWRGRGFKKYVIQGRRTK